MPDVAQSAVAARTTSFVEWSAVFAGALIAAAISFVLHTFGLSIGLSFVSPWENASAPAWLTTSVAVFWSLASQIGSFMVGGYVAGRMRSRWGEASTDEIEFRDGLHGALVWALGVVIGAALLLTTAAGLLRGAADVGARAAGTAASAAFPAADPAGYLADTLLRGRTQGGGGAPAQAGSPAQPAPNAEQRAEVVRILARSAASGSMSEGDKTYLAQVVAQRSGLPPPEAQKRVEDTFAEANRLARETADKARRAGILTGLITGIGLLVALGAAWWAAQRGGNHRDNAVAARLFPVRRPTAGTRG